MYDLQNAHGLSVAIVRQAISDYAYVCRNGDDTYDRYLRRAKLEEFFRGKLFATLTSNNIEPERFMRDIRQGRVKVAWRKAHYE
jgi:hypothetical protein